MQDKNFSKPLIVGSTILGVVLVITGILVYFKVPFITNNQNTSTDNTVTSEQSVSLVVTDNSETEHIYMIPFTGEKSAFDLLQDLKKTDSEFKFEYTESAYGVYITSFYGFAPKSSEAFWEFIINGESSMVGVSDYKVKSEDEIEFKLTKIEPLN